jgi:phospholipase/carboxylesterase
MKRQRFGSLDTVVTGGVDRVGGGVGPVVILLHGFGAPAEDLVPLWRAIDVPREVRWIFPAAPLSLAPYGYPAESRAWWPLDLARFERLLMGGRTREMAKEVPEGIVSARAAVTELLAVVKDQLKPTKIVLGGFSQGAMLSVDVALRTNEPLSLALLSGTLICEDEWDVLLQKRGKELRVFQSHGKDDPLLPYALAEVLRDKLTASGADVAFVSFRGGHEIPAQALDKLTTYLRGVTSGS